MRTSSQHPTTWPGAFSSTISTIVVGVVMVMLLGFIMLLLLLFIGTPDLHDALIYFITQGAYK